MSRRASRETVMKLLYQSEFHNEGISKVKNEIFEESASSESEKAYIGQVFSGVFEKKAELDAVIESHLKGWKINRISKVDLSILRTAVYEIKFIDEIPISVSINEAIELAKKFSTAESASFINGLLSSIVKDKS
ncbi:MAG: transcription antitermination factor NusB [Eubacteriales bacterium]|nr:transcription antitermination factor NusB [Eubacteriales bacterium]